MMSIDGMHWCMESLGGRIMAATACLLQCSFIAIGSSDKNDIDNGNVTKMKTKQAQLECEQRCNEEFMSTKKAQSLAAVSISTTTT
jgi:hypothetical protein